MCVSCVAWRVMQDWPTHASSRRSAQRRMNAGKQTIRCMTACAGAWHAMLMLKCDQQGQQSTKKAATSSNRVSTVTKRGSAQSTNRVSTADKRGSAQSLNRVSTIGKQGQHGQHTTNIKVLSAVSILRASTPELTMTRHSMHTLFT